MSGQTWTPAPKKGIIPLHPLTFGMILGKAFAALRHNPKVLFGFAVVLQLIVTIVAVSVMAVVLVLTFTRLESVSPMSPDFEAVAAGAIATNLVAGLAVGLSSVAFTAVLQGIVSADIGYAAIGVKASVKTLWRRMRPAFWRLAAFALLSIVAVFLVFAIFVGILAGLAFATSGTDLIGVIILIGFLLALGFVPLGIWLSTKLMLVPSILVLEQAKFRDALVRSWRLTRGRFWVAFGVMALISVVMGLAMQVVSIPVSLFGGIFASILAPTGSDDVGGAIGMVLMLVLPQILLLILQAITLVVQCTGSALVYLDCRMRYEGLDQTLVAHVERRDLGWSEDQLDDPYTVDPSRAVSSAPPPKQVPEYVAAPAGYGYQGYPAQGYAPQYPTQPYPAQPYGAQPYPAQPYPAQPYPAQPYGAAQYPAPPAPPAPPSAEQAVQAAPIMPLPEPPSDSPWAAPGSGSA